MENSWSLIEFFGPKINVCVIGTMLIAIVYSGTAIDHVPVTKQGPYNYDQ